MCFAVVRQHHEIAHMHLMHLNKTVHWMKSESQALQPASCQPENVTAQAQLQESLATCQRVAAEQAAAEDEHMKKLAALEATLVRAGQE